MTAETWMVQIMDPKMDSGYLQPGETLEDEYDVMRKLLPEEILGIMDQMLCFEVCSRPLIKGDEAPLMLIQVG